jgi:hypothetical protein
VTWHPGVWSVGTNILERFLQSRRVRNGKRAAHSSKMLIPLYQPTLCHIQEDCKFSLKSSFTFQFLILHSYSFNHNAWKDIYTIQSFTFLCDCDIVVQNTDFQCVIWPKVLSEDFGLLFYCWTAHVFIVVK